LHLKQELIEYLTSTSIAFLQSENFKQMFIPALDSLLYYNWRQGAKSESSVFDQLIADLDTIIS
jgi:hypothetical protein